MSVDKKLDLLNKINRVDTPPFLLTRIQGRIHSLTNAQAPTPWKWGFAVTAILVLALNMVLIIRTTAPKKDTGVESLVNSLHLSSSNDLYHE